MLVDNKFIYLSLPRCASTAFFISCIRCGFTIRHANSIRDKSYENIDLRNLTNMDLVYNVNHFHETINALKEKFGNDYDIISVKRNRYDRFISYFNHCIGELNRNGNLELADIFSNLSTEDLLFYKTENLFNKESKIELLHSFLKRIGYSQYNNTLETLLLPMVSPVSVYHNNNPKIIWFEFNQLNKLENWVATKTGIPFKLEVFGSSGNYKSKIINDDFFVKKYSEIYDYFDFFKKQNTLI